jgi:hypothetical protein
MAAPHRLHEGQGTSKLWRQLSGQFSVGARICSTIQRKPENGIPRATAAVKLQDAVDTANRNKDDVEFDPECSGWL